MSAPLHRARSLCVALVLAAPACLDDRPEWHPWQDASSISGSLRPEVQSATVSPPAPTTLRLVSYNVARGEDLPRLAGAIEENELLRAADVLLLQEIEDHPSDAASGTHQLASALGLNFAYAPARETDDGGTHGLAVLSRFPLTRVEVMELPFFDLGHDSRRRIALGVTIDVAGTPLVLIDAHLDTRLNINQRLLQVEPAVVSAATRVAIGGDFNTNPYAWIGRSVPLLPAGTTSRVDQAQALDSLMRYHGFEAPTASLGSTTNLPVLPEMRLDSIYCRELVPIRGGIERAVRVSDHLPVWVELAWPPEEQA